MTILTGAWPPSRLVVNLGLSLLTCTQPQNVKIGFLLHADLSNMTAVVGAHARPLMGPTTKMRPCNG